MALIAASAMVAEITPVTLDFSDAFTSALNGINSDYAKYALIAIPVALALWSAPRVIKMVMRFFASLTH